MMIVHVAPESAVGGAIAAVETGDTIALDVDAGRLDLEVDSREIERRLADRPPVVPAFRRGYEALYLDHVLQANEGCDLDVLRRRSDEEPSDYPPGLMSGWVLGD